MTAKTPAPSEREQVARAVRRNIGSRIIVYGPSGSGKTTVSRQIGELLQLPVIELDALFHQPNWEPTPDDEFREKVLAALDRHEDGWVCDGNYSRVRDDVLPRAETVIWLRPPFIVTYWRLLKRTIGRALTREVLWGTNRESWRLAFFSRDSILLWGITNWRPHQRKTKEALAEIPHNAQVMELHSQRAVEELLSGLEVG